MRPKSIQPAKEFWKSGSRQCVLYVIDNTFEVRLLEQSNVVSVAVCRDRTHADQTARHWLTRPPRATAQTVCPRCQATSTRPDNHTPGYVYLRCNACRALWRIAERRGAERVAAEGAFARRRAQGAL